MKLETQVSNLELSKKLKELGVKQDSYHYYFKQKGHGEWTMTDFDLAQVVGNPNYKMVSAYTVAELYKLHIEKFSQCHIRNNIRPEYLADYLAESYINKVKPDVI